MPASIFCTVTKKQKGSNFMVGERALQYIRESWNQDYGNYIPQCLYVLIIIGCLLCTNKGLDFGPHKHISHAIIYITNYAAQEYLCSFVYLHKPPLFIYLNSKTAYLTESETFWQQGV